MFKKKPTIKPLAPLRSSDRRKLADQIINDFQLDTNTDRAQTEQTVEQKAEATAARTSLRNSLLPDNVQSARFTTTKGPDLKPASGTIYVGSQNGEEARILWFQVEGRMYPSVYTLWRNPGIVPLLHTPDIVVKKLQGGADLMTPGLAGGPPFPARATKGAVVGIASTTRPSVPLAVGVCEIDVSQLGSVQGAKGHAVESMHWAGDEIWNYSSAGRAGQQPPEELDGWTQILVSQGLVEKTEQLELEDHEEAGGVSLGDGVVPPRQDAPPAESTVEDPGVAAEPEGADVEVKELTQKEIDQAFRDAFLFGVNHYKSTNSNQHHFGLSFPLSASFVMSNLLQPFLPAYTLEQAQQLQIKKTSWKNLKKFIKSLDKEMIIKSKDQGGHETVIFDIDFDDSAIVNFKPYPLPKKQTMAGSSLGRGEAGNEKIDVGDDAVGQKLQILSFYRPSAKLQPFFKAASATKGLFTPPEVRELVTTYIESSNLISKTNKRLVELDVTLASSVFDGSGALDKEVVAKGSVPRDALVDRILRGMASSYAILRNDADLADAKVKSGAPPRVHVTLETRSGNKTVTKVSGLEPFHVNPRPLADELRKVCAGSTSVEPLLGAARKNEKEVLEVMIQGPQKDAVIKALERRGVDKRWVEVLDKTKGKKK